MKRKIDQLTPYPFASDFSAPEPGTGDRVQMSAQELAMLLADAQANGAALARNDALAAQADALAQASTELKSVLTGIVDLAAFLEKATLDEGDRRDALERVRRLAAVVIDQQGDLFRP